MPGNGDPLGVAVDGGFVYWADVMTDQILRGAADGSGSATELFNIADYPGSPGQVEPQLIAVIPEPSTLALWFLGLVGLMSYGRRPTFGAGPCLLSSPYNGFRS